MKPIYQMWSELEENIGPEATARIQRFYAFARGTLTLDDLEQFNWNKAIRALAFYEGHKRPALGKDQTLIDTYELFLSSEREEVKE